MAVPEIRCSELVGPGPGPGSEAGGAGGDRPLLVLGPALGTSGLALWAGAAQLLAPAARILVWDLPGYGGTAAAQDDFSIAELARGVLAAVDAVLNDDPQVETEPSFVYSGCSVGGAVGLQLLVDAPQRLSAAAILASEPQLGDPSSWRERAELVAAAGTPTQIIPSASRWFAPGFIERDAAAGTGISTGLLHSLQNADRHGYAQVCRALAGFDLRERMGEIRTPVLALSGAQDTRVPSSAVEQWAQEVPGARAAQIEEAAHLLPAEQPQQIAQHLDHLIRNHAGGRP